MIIELFAKNLLDVVLWCIIELRLERTFLQLSLFQFSSLFLQLILLSLYLFQPLLIELLINGSISRSYSTQSDLLRFLVNLWCEAWSFIFGRFLTEKNSLAVGVRVAEKSQECLFELRIVKYRPKLIHFLENRFEKNQLVFGELLNWYVIWRNLTILVTV